MKLLIILLFLFTISFVTIDNAYALSISSAVANDPDDGDTVYSAGDTITITFPVQANATFANTIVDQLFIEDNFFFENTDILEDDSLSGVWDSTSTILTINIESVEPDDNTNPQVGFTNVSYSPEGNIHEEVSGKEFEDGDLLLTGDFGLFVAVTTTNDKNGSGCSGDCTEPTLGLNNDGRRLVDNGFTYNGKSIDVERFFTPYPLITVNVGEPNVAKFKIYDNGGVDNISHFELAFGLAKGEIIGNSKAVINWDKSFDGIETITLDDPENVLDIVSVLTSETLCSEDSKQKCLLVKINHIFRAPLDFNILGTNVWDTKRNAWQNYFNHGIEVEGESLNPPKEYDGINRGHIYHLIETDKNKAIDEFGDKWSLKHGVWSKDYIPHKRMDDLTMQGYDRDNSNFKMYKYGQQLIAEDKLREICGKCFDEPFAEINDIFFYPLN